MRYYSAVWCLKFHTNCRSGWGWVVACRRCDGLDFFNEKKGEESEPGWEGRAGRAVGAGGHSRGTSVQDQTCPLKRGGTAGRERARRRVGAPSSVAATRWAPVADIQVALDRINSLLIDNQSIIDRLSIGDWRHLSTDFWWMVIHIKHNVTSWRVKFFTQL